MGLHATEKYVTLALSKQTRTDTLRLSAQMNAARFFLKVEVVWTSLFFSGDDQIEEQEKVI